MFTKKGICVCNVGYGNYDCSLSLSEPPILYKSTYENNTFDLSNQTLTDIILVVSKFVANSNTAALRCTLLRVT
jgi:hypothetical protein